MAQGRPPLPPRLPARRRRSRPGVRGEAVMTMAFDQIDRRIVREAPPPAARTLAQRLNAELRDAHPATIIRAAYEHFGERLALGSSFGAESAVLLDLAAQVDPA